MPERSLRLSVYIRIVNLHLNSLSRCKIVELSEAKVDERNFSLKIYKFVVDSSEGLYSVLTLKDIIPLTSLTIFLFDVYLLRFPLPTFMRDVMLK